MDIDAVLDEENSKIIESCFLKCESIPHKNTSRNYNGCGCESCMFILGMKEEGIINDVSW